MYKREFLRVKSIHLVYYTLVHNTGEIFAEGLGRTLNVSMGGSLIEIDTLVDDDVRTLTLEMALAESILKVKGRIAFTRRTGAKRTELGIQFIDITDRMQDDIAEFLNRYDEETGKSRNLLREKLSEIKNVVLTLSKEHKIINDYVIACRKMLEKKDHDDNLQNLQALFHCMEKDLNAHFEFEEKVLFPAALEGDASSDLPALVDELAYEHDMISQGLKPLLSYLAELAANKRTIDKVSHGKIESFMTQIKNHARNEMVNLFPRIDADPAKIRALNTLISKKQA